MTLGSKLIGGCAVTAVAIVALGASSISAVGTLCGELEDAIHVSARKIEIAGQVSAAVSDMAAQQRGYLADLLGNKSADVSSFQREFDSLAGQVEKALEETARLAVTAEGKQAVQSMRAELDGWRRSFGHMVQLCAEGR